MLRHDAQRFRAFTRFIYCNNDQEFLQCLQQAYADFGIGKDLDFGALTAAWLADATFPTEWRLAILRQTPCHPEDLTFESRMSHEIPSDLHYTSFEWHRTDCPFIDGVTSFVGHVVAKLFKGKPQPNWFNRQQNLAIALAPLLEPKARADLLKLFDRWFDKNLRDNKGFEQKFEATLGNSLRQWANQLAQGDGDWAQVTRWLKDANCNPALLATILSHPPACASSDYISPLSGVRLLLLQIRELLLQGEHSDEVWANLTLQHLQNFYYIEKQYSALLPNYFSPLIRKLVQNPSLWQLCRDDATPQQRSTFKILFDAFALANYFSDSSANFSHFITRIPDKLIHGLAVSECFAEQHPDLALAFEQQKYKRCQQITPRLKDAAGLAWYHALLTDSLASGGIHFNLVLEHLLDFADAKRQHELIQTYLLSNESTRVPDGMLARRHDAQQLLVYLESENDRLVEQTVQRLYELASIAKGSCEEEATSSKHPDNWPILLTASAKYPDVLIENFRWLACDDPARWELLWTGATEEEQQLKLAGELIDSLESQDQAQIEASLTLISRLFAATPDPWRHCLDNLSSDGLLSFLEKISTQPGPALGLVPVIVARYVDEIQFEQLAAPLASDLLNRALIAHPEALSALDKKDALRLFALLDDGAMVACADQLIALAAGRTAEIRLAAVSLIARMPPQVIAATGLLNAPAPVRLLTLIGMASSQHPEMVELIQAQLNNKQHNHHSRGLSLEALERAGYAIDRADDWADADLTSLQAQAQNLSAPADVQALWHADCASLLAPLGEHLGLQLLQEMREGLIQLPRRARQLLAFIPAQQQHEFALWCLQRWVVDKGEALRWLLLPLTVHGDKACEQALLKAAKSLQQKKPGKSRSALAWLAQLPNQMGLPALVDLWQNPKSSAFLRNGAEQALAEAAQRRGIALDELLEQLVPSFGFSLQGLDLEIGSCEYKLQLQPDLSLLIVDKKNQNSTTLASAIDGESPSKRKRTETLLAQLNKQLELERQRQTTLLNDRFQLGYQWSIARWQRTFRTHPLWAALAQSLVWSVTDEQGQCTRVLPLCSGDLMTLDAEPYLPPPVGSVNITHPLEISPEECEAWAAEFAKRQLISPIAQWSTPVMPKHTELDEYLDIRLPAQTVISQESYDSLAQAWGLIPSDDGFSGDGVETDVIEMDFKRWQIELAWQFSSQADGEDSTHRELYRLTLRRREIGELTPYPLERATPALLNTLRGKASALVLA